MPLLERLMHNWMSTSGEWLKRGLEERMGFGIDTSTAFGAEAVNRIEAQKLAWLTTVDSKGTPQPNPVWF